MPNNSARLSLFAPGCFSAVAHSDEDVGRFNGTDTPIDLNDAKALQTHTTSYEQALSARLHQPLSALGEIPIAHYRYRVETGTSAPEHCVCAELVHLQADKDNARLLPFAALSVTDEESTALIDSFNQLINPDGLNIESTGNGHYFLCGMPASSLDTWPAHAVANGKIANYLPRASEAGDWRRLITEVQMLFHSHPVNAARAAAGQLPVNAMWFWGGAKANAVPLKEEIVLVAEDAFACGLAKDLNLTVIPAEDVQWDSLKCDVVVVDTAVYNAWLKGDQDGLIEEKANLQTRWIQPAQRAVANGQLSEFVLDGCEGQAIVETPRSSSTGVAGFSSTIKSWFRNRQGNK